MSTIPPLDLTQQYRLIEAEVSGVVGQVLASGQYIGGASVSNFEQAFGAYIGTGQVVGCNSGTDALYLALRALDIGPGDEVITTPFTFFATAEVISNVGATPVFVDIEPHTFNLDLTAVEAAITPQTRALLPVHLFGQPMDMERLQAIAQAHGLAIIEDCAQATGAKWAGHRVGSQSTIGCFSFFPTKNLGACGDGGAITTHDPDLAERIRRLKNHGSPQRYYHNELGINSRLDGIQAAILQVKLAHLDQWNQQRQAIADRYNQALAHIPGIITPQAPTGGTSVWHQYTLRVQTCEGVKRCTTVPCNQTKPGYCRDWLRTQLQSQGISTMIYYPIPLHLQEVYESLNYQPGQLPVAEQVAQEVLSLPMFPELTIQQQDQVINAIKDLCQG